MYINKFLRKTPLILLIFLISCSETNQRVLFDSLTLNGGIYYYDNEPFTGIGFSDWEKGKNKKTVDFEEGQIKSIVRYYQSRYKINPMDSLVFDENQNLIYQKRWITDDLFIEVDTPEDMFGPRSNDKINRLTVDQIKNEWDHEFKKIQNEWDHDNITIENMVDSLKNFIKMDHVFVSNWLKFNKSNNITSILSGQRYKGSYNNNPFEDFLSDLDNLDLHFTGNGEPQIDGRYKYIDDLYIYPEFGEEGMVPGFNIHTRYIDGNNDRPFTTKFTIYDNTWYFKFGDKDENYYNQILNSFYLVDKISEDEYKFFIRPYLLENGEYNDPYNPIFYVLNLNYKPDEKVETFRTFNENLIHDFVLNIEFYSSYHFNEVLSLSTKRNAFYRKSVFDKYQRNNLEFKNTISSLLDPSNEDVLIDFYNETVLSGNKESDNYVKKNVFKNLKKDEFVVIAPSGLNLRSLPSPTSKTILKIDFEKVVRVINKTPRTLSVKDYDTLGNYKGKISGHWVKVEYTNYSNGVTNYGYLFDGYLSKKNN